MSLPLIRLTGTSYEQGLRHGEALRERIAANLDTYFRRFEHEGGLPRAEALRRAGEYLGVLASRDPEYFDGMRGIAEGSGFPLDEIAMLNVRYELLYDRYSKEAMGEGCTSYAALPARTADRHTLMGQNWDWIPRVQGAVLHTRHGDGVRTLAFTEAGIFGGKIGFNNLGRGLAVNGLLSTADDWSRLAKPFHVRCYQALRSARQQEAVAALTTPPYSCSSNYVLGLDMGEGRGMAMDVETAPTGLGLLDADHGIVVHANHFVDPQRIGVEQPPLERGRLSEARHQRLLQLLRRTRPITVEALMDLLRDHQNYPNAICRHPDESLPEQERSITVASVIMDLTTREMWLTDRQPCENAYQHVRLDG